MTEDKDDLRKELENALSKGKGPAIARFALACISGVVPLAGGAIGGGAGAWSEAEQSKFNKIFTAWLKLQEEEIKEIGMTLMEIMLRLDTNDSAIQERLESPEYMALIKKAFRDWSAAESEEKRILIRNLLSNAASIKLCPDQLVRLFIEWIARYSEMHFAVIKDIYHNEGATRAEIWSRIDGRKVRDDSHDADLFKLLIHDLSVGHIIRQHRQKDYHGRFIKEAPQKREKSSGYMASAFEDGKQYELTELGKQFVHYAMTETVRKLPAAENSSASA